MTPEAEQAVLGALMLDSRLFSAISTQVCSEDFRCISNRSIWEAIRDLCCRGEPCDAVSVSEYLERASASAYEQAGGLVYLACLVRDTPAFVIELVQIVVAGKDFECRLALSEAPDRLSDSTRDRVELEFYRNAVAWILKRAADVRAGS